LLLVLATDSALAIQERDRFEEAYHVTGVVEKAGDGGRHLHVAYTDPVTGQPAKAETHVSGNVPLPKKGDTIPLEVAKSDTSKVVLQGDRYSMWQNLPWFLPFLVPGVVVWALRERRMRRSTGLALAALPAFAMTAEPVAPTGVARRWRLELYPLDAPGTADPTCTVPLIEAPRVGGRQGVEVKGPPRPSAEVVVRDAHGNVLWPSGRALSRTTKGND
jgi:hypothetical protein